MKPFAVPTILALLCFSSTFAQPEGRSRSFFFDASPNEEISPAPTHPKGFFAQFMQSAVVQALQKAVDVLRNNVMTGNWNTPDTIVYETVEVIRIRPCDIHDECEKEEKEKKDEEETDIEQEAFVIHADDDEKTKESVSDKKDGTSSEAADPIKTIIPENEEEEGSAQEATSADTQSRASESDPDDDLLTSSDNIIMGVVVPVSEESTTIEVVTSPVITMVAEIQLVEPNLSFEGSGTEEDNETSNVADNSTPGLPRKPASADWTKYIVPSTESEPSSASDGGKSDFAAAVITKELPRKPASADWTKYIVPATSEPSSDSGKSDFAVAFITKDTDYFTNPTLTEKLSSAYLFPGKEVDGRLVKDEASILNSEIASRKEQEKAEWEQKHQ